METQTPKTIIDLLLDESDKAKEREIFYISPQEEITKCCHADEIIFSKRILDGLKRKGLRKGNYVIIALNDEQTFFRYLWACILGGIIPVPINCPYNSTTAEKLTNVFNVLDDACVIASINEEKFIQGIPPAAIFYSEEIFENLSSEVHYVKPSVSLSDIALIQFSSGSTGVPKGVIITHKNILKNIQNTGERIKTTPDDVIFCWLPHTHDFGLIGNHFGSIYSSSKYIKLSPRTFAKKPNFILSLLDKFSATVYSSPNFGLNWLVSNFDEKSHKNLDLSSIRLVLNGGEPISVHVIEKFLETFSRFNLDRKSMSPVYGLAEGTLAVTIPEANQGYSFLNLNQNELVNNNRIVTEKEMKSHNLQFVKLGKPIKGVEILIKKETGELCKEEELGIVYLSGASITQGYINNQTSNKKLFKDGWFNTEDIGFISQGELIICDRKRNIACINGVNIFFKDLEEVIYVDTKIKRGSAFFISAKDKNQTEDLVLFIKHRGAIGPFIDYRNACIESIARRFQIRLKQVIPVSTLPKTTSGKFQRGQVKKKYLNGEFDQIIMENNAAIAKQNALLSSKVKPGKTAIRQIIASVLQIPIATIADGATFQSLGVSSLEGMKLMVNIEKELGIELEQKDLVSGYNFVEFCKICELKFERKKLQKTTKHHDESSSDVSIIGMSCNFPASPSLKAFGENLRLGKSFFHKVSADRKRLTNKPNWDDYLAEICDPFDFDADFFNISEEEAKFIDPQQRICLEQAYLAILDAGILSEIKKDNRVGVFIGASHSSFASIISSHIGEGKKIHPNTMANNTLSMIASRISKYFGLKGEAFVIDSACSSSLVAIDHAILRLKSGKINKAIVGGVNLVLTPEIHVLAKSAGILSKNGVCKVFDEKADGTVLGEGVGFVVLELEENRRKNNHYSYAEIISSFVNNDGTALSIMAPNAKGQTELVSNALHNSGVNIEKLNYVEAHGTGTAIGDPVELMSLNNAYKNKKSSCSIGSVKSNIGHLLAAAGIAGLIKTTLSVSKNVLFPTVNLTSKNSLIDFENSPFSPVEKYTEDTLVAYAGISSFGFGGTNSHVIIKSSNKTKINKELDEFVLAISWRNQLEKVKNINDIIKKIRSKDSSVYDICVNSLLRVEHRGERKFFVVKNSKKEIEGILVRELEILAQPIRLFKIQKAQLVISRLVEDIGIEQLQMLIPYLNLDKEEEVTYKETIKGGSILAKNIAFYYAFSSVLNQFCIGTKLIATNDFQAQKLLGLLAQNIGLTELLNREWKMGSNEKETAAVFKKMALPTVGFIKIDEENNHVSRPYKCIQNQTLISMLSFFSQRGLEIQWHRIFSLDTVPNWNCNYHEFQKKTLLPN